MPRTRDPARFQARQNEILAAAAALFAERGFHQTGVAELCAALQMSPGALYRYFPSKDAIILALVEADVAKADRLLDVLGESDDFQPALVEVLSCALQDARDDRYARLALEIAAEASRNPAVGEVLNASAMRLRARLQKLIETARAAGRIDPDADPVAATTLLIMLVEGATGCATLAAGFDPAALRPQLERVVCGLLGPPRAR